LNPEIAAFHHSIILQLLLYLSIRSARVELVPVAIFSRSQYSFWMNDSFHLVIPVFLHYNATRLTSPTKPQSRPALHDATQSIHQYNPLLFQARQPFCLQ